MAYFVFRINYGDWFGKIRTELLQNSKLRQGWGTYDMEVNQGCEHFKAGWRLHWGDENISDNEMEKRFNNLAIMNEIKPGDYIIVPKVSTESDAVCRSFVVAKCRKTYQFSVLEEAGDFGHIIEVESVFSCGYDKNSFSQNICGKFVAYQSPINRVLNSTFKEAVDALVNLHNSAPEEFERDCIDLTDMMNTATRVQRRVYLESLVSNLRNLSTHKFEDIICELFERNGYTMTKRNWYDREGGDVDIVFEAFNDHTLMHSIFEVCELEMPHIYVQAKKKEGIDYGDIVGVDQLNQMKGKIEERSYVLIVINLADGFTKEARELANENGIILIEGLTFASLLVRYGIEVDMN